MGNSISGCKMKRSESEAEAERYIKPPITFSEAEHLAITVSEDILPSKALVKKITKNLELIRQKHPVVTDIEHREESTPGQIIANASLTDRELKSINDSEFGPIHSVDRLLLGTKMLTIVNFTKSYNPALLAREIRAKFGFDATQHFNIGDGNTVFYDPERSIYTFKKGWGETPGAKCPNNHYWEFHVPKKGKPTLEKEYGTALGIRKINRLTYTLRCEREKIEKKRREKRERKRKDQDLEEK